MEYTKEIFSVFVKAMNNKDSDDPSSAIKTPLTIESSDSEEEPLHDKEVLNKITSVLAPKSSSSQSLVNDYSKIFSNQLNAGGPIRTNAAISRSPVKLASMNASPVSESEKLQNNVQILIDYMKNKNLSSNGQTTPNDDVSPSSIKLTDILANQTSPNNSALSDISLNDLINMRSINSLNQLSPKTSTRQPLGDLNGIARGDPNLISQVMYADGSLG